MSSTAPDDRKQRAEAAWLESSGSFDERKGTLIRDLLSAGASLEVKNKDGNTPLFVTAFSKGNQVLCETLVKANADCSSINFREQTPLFAALSCDDTPMAEFIITGLRKQGRLNPSALSTLLHLVAKKNRAWIFKYDDLKPLWDSWINQQNEVGDTPLHVAVQGESLAVIENLLSFPQIDLNIVNELGDTPLHKAMKFLQYGLVPLLIEKGSDVNSVDDKGNSLIHQLAENLDIPENIRSLVVQKTTNFNLKNKGGDTPLLIAVKKGNTDIIKTLLDKGADTSIRDEEGNTALHVAVKSNNSAVVEWLLAKDADTSIPDQDGNTPLQWAIKNNQVYLARLLVPKSRCDKVEYLKSAVDGLQAKEVETLFAVFDGIEYRDDAGRTLLSHAIFTGDEGLIQAAINVSGDRLDEVDGAGYTPLQWAMVNQQEPTALKLLDCGASATAPETLQLAIQYGLLEVVKFLAENLKTIDSEGCTPMHWAARYGHQDIIEYIYKEAPETINSENNQGLTPLHMASFAGHVDAVQALLEQGADLSAQDQHGNTALNLAIQQGHVDVIHEIIKKMGVETPLDKTKLENRWKALENRWKAMDEVVSKDEEETLLLILAMLVVDADTSITDRDGNTPLQWAIKNNQVDLARLLVPKSRCNPVEYLKSAVDRLALEEVETLFKVFGEIDYLKEGLGLLNHAIYTGNVGLIQAAINVSRDKLDEVDDTKQTPLCWAIVNGQNPAALTLLDHGAGATTVNGYGFTPLKLAIQHGMLDVVKGLVEKGAELIALDTEGYTPMHWAARYEKIDIIQYLYSAEPDTINSRDTQQQTPLHIASSEGHADAVQALLEQGANLSAQDQHGNTALHLAIQKGHVGVINEIIKDERVLSEAGLLEKAIASGHLNVINTLYYAIKPIETPLVLAIGFKNLEVAKKLMKNPYLNQKNSAGETPLQWTSRTLDLEAYALALIEAGANLEGETVLQTAVSTNNMTLVNALLAKTSEVSRDLILSASMHENFELFRALFKKRGSLFQLDLMSQPTLIQEAILSKIGVEGPLNEKNLEDRWKAMDEDFSQDKEKTLLLILAMLEVGADLNLPSKTHGRTPLHWMACHPDLARYIPMLISHGASVNASDDEGNRPLHLAAKHNTAIDQLGYPLEEGQLKRASFDGKNKEGKTPIHLAAKAGHLDVFKALLKRKIKIDEKDKHDQTPLLLAIHAGKIRIVSEIFSKMKPKDASESNRLLEEAVKSCDDVTFIESFYDLLDRNGTVTENPLNLAIEQNKWKLAKALMKAPYLREANLEHPLHFAINKESWELAKSLMTEPYLNARNAEQQTPLDLAITLLPNNSSYVIELVRASADLAPLEAVSTEKLQSLVHIAAQEGLLNLVRLLVLKGVDINAKTIEMGQSPLHVAVIEGHVDVVRELLQSMDIKLDLKDASGRTAMHHAAELGNLDMVKALCEKGARVDIKNQDGKTPSMLAKKNNKTEIVNFFKTLSTRAQPRPSSHRPGQVRQAQASSDVDINAQDAEGNTELHRAVKAGDLGRIQSLLDQTPDLTLTNHKRETAFALALKVASCECIKRFIQKDQTLALNEIPSIQYILTRLSHYPPDKLGHLLHLVVEQLGETYDGNQETVTPVDVQFFLETYAPPSLAVSDHMGYTALHLAARDPKKWWLLEKLIELGGNPLQLDATNQDTPLRIASSFVTADNVEQFRHLLKVCIDKNRLGVNPSGFTPTATLDYALTHNFSKNLISALLNEGVLIDKPLQNGKTPIQQALEMKNLDMIKILITHGAQLDLKNPEVQNKLDASALAEIKTLQQQLKGLEKRFKNGKKINEQEIIQLVQQGVDLRALSSKNKTLMALAQDKGPEFIKKFRAIHEAAHRLQPTYQDRTNVFYKSVDKSSNPRVRPEIARLKATYKGKNMKADILEAIRMDFQVQKTIEALIAARTRWELTPEYQWLRENRTVWKKENTRSVDALTTLFNNQLAFINEHNEINEEQPRGNPPPHS